MPSIKHLCIKPIWRTAAYIVSPCPCKTSNYRTFDTISSGFSLFTAIASPPNYETKISQLLEHLLWAIPVHSLKNVSPHSALGNRPPEPKSIIPVDHRPTINEKSNWIIKWGQANSGHPSKFISHLSCLFLT